MPTDSTDEQLLAAATTDGDAFAEFYLRHSSSVLAYTTTRLGSADLGAEATAETFAAALEGLRRYDPHKGSATAWLYGIARHQVSRALDRGRVERTYRRRMGIRELRPTDEELERLEERVAREAATPRVRELLSELSDDQRDALDARVVRELHYDEIALDLDTTQAAARKRVSRALAHLRSKLGANP